MPTGYDERSIDLMNGEKKAHCLEELVIYSQILHLRSFSDVIQYVNINGDGTDEHIFEYEGGFLRMMNPKENYLSEDDGLKATKKLLM